MADAVGTTVFENGNQWFRAKFTNLSDGTGESAVTKLDPTSAASGANNMGVVIQGNTLYPGTHLKIMQIDYTVSGMTLQMIWDATTPNTAWLLQGFGKMDFTKQGGIAVPQSSGAPITGATGIVKFTTLGAGGGSSYTVDIWCKKDIVQ
jgi:hypothetical protein